MVWLVACWWSLAVGDKCVLAQTTPQPPKQSSEPKQQDNRVKQSSEPDLTEGLLDLLNEPTPQPTPAPVVGGGKGEFKPSDVGLEGEDLGENGTHPLTSVRQSMLIAAGLIQRGATGSETQQLQADIVQRLDELIEQLEQTPRNQNEQPQPQNEQQRNQTTEQQLEQQSEQQQARQSTASMGEESESKEVSESDGEPQQPGLSGREASGQLRLADPKALQQDVWGHLPERMRAQMQSRMVEQFLPSHREQIEAYFRALLDVQR